MIHVRVVILAKIMVDALQVSVRVVMRAHVCQHLRDQRVNWVRFFNKKKNNKN
jgi:hypothetical protein